MSKYKYSSSLLERVRGTSEKFIKEEDLPTWNSEVPYDYEIDTDNPNFDIENATGSITLHITYNNLNKDSSWDYYKSIDAWKQFVKETHVYSLKFDEFDDVIHGEYSKDGPSYLCKRNINGTYVKKTVTTVNYRKNDSSDIETYSYNEVLEGDFKSFDFDYETCRLPNDSLFRKTLCFLNETFVSSDDPKFDITDGEDEPNYVIFFKEGHCQAHLFSGKEKLNAFRIRPDFNNRPDEKWTYFFIEGYRDDVPFSGARAIGICRTGDNTADILIDDIRNINDIDSESISRLTFKDGSNVATGVHDDDNVVTLYTFDFIDPAKKVNDINDIDFDNLQDYIITCVNTKENSEEFDEKTRVDMIPGFVFDGKWAL
tara:strand:+ start:585 stop:1697 length:1113 start_codon:yes stop_codon:yes gene_type:complete